MKSSVYTLALIVAFCMLLISCSGQEQCKVIYSNLEMVDFLRFRETPLLYTQGLEGVEQSGLLRWRWMHGPRAYIAFLSAGANDYCVKFEFNNTIPKQSVRIMINGEFQRSYQDLPATPWVMVTIPDSIHFKARPGLNVIEFEFTKYNRKDFMPDNDLPIAVNFRELKIYLEK